MSSEASVEDFLSNFSQKCVEFGYYCDQYMREEINLGEITRRMSEATGEGEAFFESHQDKMSPDEVSRYEIMQKTLDEMTTNLIETEIQRNEEIIQEALSKGEYFIVNITFNSIHSSIYMVYSSPGNTHQQERDRKLAQLQQSQELTQALMKVLKVIDQKIKPEKFDAQEYKKLVKAFQIYVEYFKRVEQGKIKTACDGRVVNQFKELVDYLQGKDYFGDRYEAYRQVSLCSSTIKEGVHDKYRAEIEAIRERVRPPNPTEQMKKLFQAVQDAQGETNIYAAVVAFQNFADAHPNEPLIGKYRRQVREVIKSKGFL